MFNYVVRPMKNFFEDTLENFNQSMKINAGSIYYFKLFGSEIAKNGGGSI